jgi:Tol biopolymer transport system component
MSRLLNLAAVALIAAAVPSTASAAFPGANGKIAWSSEYAHEYFAGRDNCEMGGDIFTMNSNGSNVRQLTTATGHDDNPVWSADGQMIVFDSARDTWLSEDDDIDFYAAPEIYVMDRLGRDQRRVTNLPDSHEYDPTWSPDGTRIAYASANRIDGQPNGVYAIDADGTDEQLLAAGGGMPAWSPDGTKIAFYRDGGLWIMDPDGGNQVRLGDGGQHPDWSPDGSRIAYGGIETITLGGIVQHVNAPGIETFGAWSPDGQRFTYQHVTFFEDPDAYPGADRQIAAIRSNGKGLNLLTPLTGWFCIEDSPNWQPIN